MSRKSSKYTLINFLKNSLAKYRRNSARRVAEQKEILAEANLFFKIEHYPTLLSRRAKQRYNLFRDTRSISAEEKSKINRFTVAKNAIRLAYLANVEDHLHLLRDRLYLFVLFGFILLNGIFYDRYLNFLYPFAGRSNLFERPADLERWFVFITILFLYHQLFEFISSRVTFTQRVVLIGGILIAGIFYLSQSWAPFRHLAFGVVGIELIRSVSIFMDTLIFLMTERHAARKMPDAVVIHNLLYILNSLDINPEIPDDNPFVFPAKKQFLITRLEYASEYLEYYIHPLLQSPSRAANEWNREQARQIANALRAKKKLIVLSKPDTWKKIRRNLIDFLIHFSRDEWGELPKLATPQKSWRENLKTQVTLITRNFVFGVLPLVILWSIQYFGLVPQVSDSLFGAAAIWAVVNILWLDPSLKEKINALKDASSTFKS